MDATANDVPTPYEVRGFPTLFWVPKDSKDSPVKYEVKVHFFSDLLVNLQVVFNNV